MAVNFNLTCSSEDLCSVECDEESACQSSTITATNAKELKCNGYRACYGGVFELSCTQEEPCEIQCEGDEACRDVTINADYVKELQCKDDGACTDAVITISSAQDDFGLECSEGGCTNAQITINATSNLGEIKCSGETACSGAAFNIINSGSASIGIEKVECDGEDACKDATFSFTGTVTIDECKCGDIGEDYGCDGTTGLTVSRCSEGGIATTAAPAPFSAANAFAAALAQDGDLDEEDLNNDDVDVGTYSYEISLSANALANLWGLAAMCLVSNLILFFCCVRKSNKSVGFDSNAANERYVSDQ